MSSGRTVILQFETAKQHGLEHITHISVLPFLLLKKVLRNKQQLPPSGPSPSGVQPSPESGSDP